ncbi:hypothetical protein [Streptomyces sp. NPDC048606]
MPRALRGPRRGPGATNHPDTGTMPCGTVLDYRSGEQQLQSHADL